MSDRYLWETRLRIHEAQRRFFKSDDSWYRNALLCNYCGVPFDWRGGRQTDHIVPLCRGGPDAMWNLIGCCARCNQKKGKGTASDLLWELEWDRWYRYPAVYAGLDWDGLRVVERIPVHQQYISQERWAKGLPALKERISLAHWWTRELAA